MPITDQPFTLGPEVIVSDGASAPSSVTDKHGDPDFAPKVASMHADITVTFDHDPPNTHYRETDYAIKLKVIAANTIPAATALFQIGYGSTFRNAKENDVPPIVVMTDLTATPGPARVTNVSAGGFIVTSGFGLNAGTYLFQFVTTAAQ